MNQLKTMMAGVALVGFAIVGMANQAAAESQALQQSNTIPSNRLITDFAVIKTAGEADVLAVINLFKAGENNSGPVMLAISPNETITITVAGKSVVCPNNAECRVPFVKEGIYSAELKRFNGEIFRAETLMPAETGIVAPTNNSVVRVSDPVQVTWIKSESNGPYGLTMSVFLGDQIDTCSTTGSISWDTDNTATIPANLVATCRAPLRARFSVFYSNLTPVRGVAGGTLKAYSVANLFFTYWDGTSQVRDIRALMNWAPATKALPGLAVSVDGMVAEKTQTLSVQH
jgi:hypothetical protein